MAEDMERAKRTILDGYEAFNRGDYDEAARHLHPDATWHRVAEVEQALEGREAVRGNMEPEIWQRQVADVHGLEVIGESIVVDTTFHAEGRGSGIRIDQDGYHLWKIRDGLGVEFRFFADREEAVRAAREREGLA